jgi:microcystin-dependent protein
MAEPFLGEIRIVSFNYAVTAQGWAMCNGQFLPINQNQALFSLLGTTYGGNGQTTFALPDLRGKVPVHKGAGFTMGQQSGEQAHTLSISEMPAHSHIMNGTTATGDNPVASGAMLAAAQGQMYTAPAAFTTLLPGTVTPIGGSQPHNNMQPYLTLTFMIALQGIFPSQN